MNRAQEDTIKELQADILASTGLKVGKDDPILSAALLQSKLLKRSAQSLYEQFSDQLQQETAHSTNAINLKINEHVFYLDERIKKLESIAETLSQSKDYMLSEIAVRSHKKAIASVKNEMAPLLNQYARYKLYAMVALIGFTCGSIPIILTVLFQK